MGLDFYLDRTKKYHWFSSFINNTFFSLTASVVMLQTMKSIAPFHYNLYELLGGLFIVLMGMFLSKESSRVVLAKNLELIIIIDYLLFSLVQLLSVESLVFRFAALALAVPLGGEIRLALTSDYINRALEGTTITSFNQTLRYLDNLGILVGLASALFLNSLGIYFSLETALVVQLLGHLPVSLVPQVWKNTYLETLRD